MGSAKRVVLFGIDGAGTFFEQAKTPNLDRIFSSGALCRRVLTEIPSISAQCWGSMLHGVPCLWHGLTNAIADVRPYPEDSLYPSVFRVIREADRDAGLVCFCDWNAINVGVVEENLGVHKFHAPDRELIDPACDYIRKNEFTLLYFHFDSVDGAGHRYGYGTPEHLAAIEENDRYVGKIVSALEGAGRLEDTLLLVEADHGGTPNYGYGGQHGGATDAEKYVCFYAAGPGILPGEIPHMLVRDTPAVILHALGIPQPEAWTARVPAGLFRDCPRGSTRPAGIPPGDPLEEQEHREERGGLLKKLDNPEPILCLYFEDDGEFPKGTQVRGKLYRTRGRMGQGMNFQDGGLALENLDLTGSFTMLFWIRPENWSAGESRIVAAAGSTCREVDLERGFCLEVGEDFVRFRQKGPIGSMPVHLDMTKAGDLREKWTHVAVTQDREKNRFGISVDFGPVEYWNIPGNMHLWEAGPFYLGQDALMDGQHRLSAVLDDYVILPGAVEEDTLAVLKDYYCR